MTKICLVLSILCAVFSAERGNFPSFLRLDVLRRVAVVHPAARGRRCIMNVTGIEIDGRLYPEPCENWKETTKEKNK